MYSVYAPHTCSSVADDVQVSHCVLLGWKGGDQGRPKSILFVEELTGLISENLPDLWKLGQTYLNKTLFQVCDKLFSGTCMK